MTRQTPGPASASVKALRVPQALALYLVLQAVIAAGPARAEDLPISGIYGTVAMCVIDAFSDIPPGDVNFGAGGAPLAHVLPGELDTPEESCAFQRILKQSESGQKQTWVIEANCTRGDANAVRELQITSDKKARTVTVSAQDGTALATLDQCTVPYAERLSRELRRMPLISKK